MTQVATVNKLLNQDQVIISVPRQSACGHDCENCVGCGMSGGQVVRAKAQNPIGAAVGDKVVVEGSTQKVLGVIFLVYLTPVVLFLLGYFAGAGFGASETVRYVLAGLGFALGIVPAVLYDRRMRKQGGLTFTIVRLF